MKTKFYKILFMVLCFSTLTACNEQEGNSSSIHTDYIAKEGKCVVSISRDYGLVYENADQEQDSMLDIDLIESKTVEGKPKNEAFNYFSVSLNEPFRIMTPYTVIQDKNNEGQTLTEWKINEISYKDEDSYLSKNVYTCIENTVIEPVYSAFKTVGMIIYHIDEEQNPKNPIFDESGNILEQEDVKYIYGKYAFDPNRDSWTTNLDLDYFNVSLINKNNQEVYHIAIRFDLTPILQKGRVAIKPLCKIADDGYMIHPLSSTEIISGTNMSMEGTFSIPLEEHVLQCTFVING